MGCDTVKHLLHAYLVQISSEICVSYWMFKELIVRVFLSVLKFFLHDQWEILSIGGGTFYEMNQLKLT